MPSKTVGVAGAFNADWNFGTRFVFRYAWLGMIANYHERISAGKVLQGKRIGYELYSRLSADFSLQEPMEGWRLILVLSRLAKG